MINFSGHIELIYTVSTFKYNDINNHADDLIIEFYQFIDEGKDVVQYRKLCLVVQAAFDTDCNGASVRSVIGAMLGKSGIPPYRYERDSLMIDSAVMDYTRLSVDQLTDKIMALLKNDADTA